MASAQLISYVSRTERKHKKKIEENENWNELRNSRNQNLIYTKLQESIFLNHENEENIYIIKISSQIFYYRS